MGFLTFQGSGLMTQDYLYPELNVGSFFTQLPIIPHYLTPTQLNQLTPTSFDLYLRFVMSSSTNSSSSYITTPAAPPSSYFGDDKSYGPIPPRDMGLFGEVPLTGIGLFPRGPVCPTICQEPAFTDDFKILFSVQLPHFPSLKSLFSQSLVTQTRQTIHMATQVHGDIKV